MAHPLTKALRRLREKDPKCEASPGYPMKFCLKTNEQNKNKDKKIMTFR